MKKKIIHYLAATVLMLISLHSFSQENKHRIPEWVSKNGYWVVESNTTQPLQHTIRFYTNENILIDKINVFGKLKLKKRSVKMQLKSMLESSLLAWNKQKTNSAKLDGTGRS